MTCFVKQESKLKAEKINVEQNLDGYIKDIQHLTGKVAGLEAKVWFIKFLHLIYFPEKKKILFKLNFTLKLMTKL